MDNNVKRHIFKTISYRLLSSFIGFITMWTISGQIKIGAALGIFELLWKPIQYFIHERIWFKFIRFKKSKSNSITLFLTGLSGSGKSAIANEFIKNEDFTSIDGDDLRKGLCSDLGFSIKDRIENMRRLRHLCNILNQNNKNVITTFISPLEEERIKAKNEINNCYIVYIKCPLEVCEERDVKGLYKKARNGEIKNFTGIDSPYEEPINPDLIIDTSKLTLKESVKLLKKFNRKVNRNKHFLI